MHLLFLKHKHQALVKLRSDVSTHKVVALVCKSQSFVRHLRKDLGGKIKRQRGGRLELLANHERRCCVTLITEGRFGTASTTTKQIQYETHKLLLNIIVRHALREARLGAQVQQKKPILCCKHVLVRLRFAQRYENWTIDDCKRVIFSDETKINRFN